MKVNSSTEMMCRLIEVIVALTVCFIWAEIMLLGKKAEISLVLICNSSVNCYSGCFKQLYFTFCVICNYKVSSTFETTSRKTRQNGGFLKQIHFRNTIMMSQHWFNFWYVWHSIFALVSFLWWKTFYFYVTI